MMVNSCDKTELMPNLYMARDKEQTLCMAIIYQQNRFKNIKKYQKFD